MGVPRPVICSLATALLVVPALVHTQQQDQQQQRPIFRTATDVVRIDVYPRRNGKIVEGLNREDFKVTEDGAAQTIDTFEFIATGGFEAEPLDPSSPYEAKKMAADPKNRVFVFYLDLYMIDMEGSARAREPLLNYFRFGLGPRDLIAITTPRQLPEYLEFTRTTEALGSILSAGRVWGLMDSPELDKDEYELEACQPGNGRPGPLVQRKRTRKVMSDLRELVIRLGLLREERKNLIVIGERWQSSGMPRRGAGPGSSVSTIAAPRINAQAGPLAQIRPPNQRGPGSFVPPPSAGDRCNQLAMAVGSPITERQIEELVTLARRANVAIYFIPPAPRTLFNGGIARGIAEDTDGMSIVSNDIGLNLTRLMEHQTGYYMIGYRPSSGEFGKKEREIRVRTAAKGVDLDIRRLYDPLPPDVAERIASPPPPVERTDVQKSMDALARLKDDEEAYVIAERRTAHVDVTIELPPKVATADPWRKGANVTVTVKSDDAEVGTATGVVAAGERSLRVAVPVADPALARRVNVELVRDGAMIRDAVAINPPSAFGAPLVFRAGALPRAPFVPAAMMSFDRTERIRVEWPISEAMTGDTVRLLNAASQERVADLVVSRISEADGPWRLRADLRLLALAAGDYSLEATGELDGLRIKQLVAIRIR